MARPSPLSLALVSGTLVAAASPASTADVQYLTQVRTVGASAGQSSGFPDLYQTVAAPGFGLFDESIEQTAVLSGDGGPYTNRGFATQNSTLGPGLISWSGEVGGTDNYPWVGQGHGVGRSALDVTFDVAAATDYLLSGFISQEDAGMGFQGLVRLSQVGGGMIFQLASAGPLPALSAFEQAGTLGPGTYRLELLAINGRIGPDTGTDSSTYGVTLVVPAPGSGVAGAAGIVAMAARRRMRS